MPLRRAPRERVTSVGKPTPGSISADGLIRRARHRNRTSQSKHTPTQFKPHKLNSSILFGSSWWRLPQVSASTRWWNWVRWEWSQVRRRLIRLEDDQTKNQERWRTIRPRAKSDDDRYVPLPSRLVMMLAKAEPKAGRVSDTSNLRTRGACVECGLSRNGIGVGLACVGGWVSVLRVSGGFGLRGSLRSGIGATGKLRAFVLVEGFLYLI
jgi:hypothetical protein